MTFNWKINNKYLTRSGEIVTCFGFETLALYGTGVQMKTRDGQKFWVYFEKGGFFLNSEHHNDIVAEYRGHAKQKMKLKKAANSMTLLAVK